MESSTAVTARMCREVMEDTIKGEGCGGEGRGEGRGEKGEGCVTPLYNRQV